MADWKKLLSSAASQIGQGAKIAGEGVREAADGARKVAGIGVGTIRIAVHGRAHLGGVLRGTVILDLPEPIAADALEVWLKGWRVRIPIENLATKDSTALRSEVLFSSGVEIGGPQTYHSGQFPFSVDIPDRAPDPEIGGVIGDVVRAAQAFKSMTEVAIRWRVQAELKIPWRRNLRTEVEIAMHEPKPENVRPAAAPPRPTPKPGPVIPAAIALPHGWPEALRACVDHIRGRGEVVLFQRARPPVDPRVVMEILGRHPDVDPEILQFYGVMDGFEALVGRPKCVAETYETARAAEAWAERHGGWIHCLHEMSTMGDALAAEFHDGPDDVRSLEIPGLADLFDEGAPFAHRGDTPAVWGAVFLGCSSYFGLTRADEIRAWRQPAPGQTGRDGYYDDYADAYQAELTRREHEHRVRWWAVLGDDHGAGLQEPARLLRWSEMLAACLDHLRGG